MNSEDKIRKVVSDFVRGGDTSDVGLLDQVLHADFRVTNNGYMGGSGVTIIDKKTYLKNIQSGIFGGLPRTMQIEQVDEEGTIASVKLRLESEENSFVSYNCLVLDADQQWKMIHNLAVVKSKK